MVNINFNFYSDSKGGDPDITSKKLKEYHKILWNKPLPNGKIFNLFDNKKGGYLYHKSELGEFFLGSDSITNSYKNHKRKKLIISQIPTEVNELFNFGSNIGAYIIFPNKKINGNHTINQARGVNSLIDDRFDLTLEFIRRFYLKQGSPLYNTLLRYKNFFVLFDNFNDYIKFFLLEDIIDENNKIKFFLPFDNFKTSPTFSNINDYISYKKLVIDFIKSRNKRIENWVKSSKK